MLCNASPRNKKKKKKKKKKRKKKKKNQITMVTKGRAMKHNDHVRKTQFD